MKKKELEKLIREELEKTISEQQNNNYRSNIVPFAKLMKTIRYTPGITKSGYKGIDFLANFLTNIDIIMQSFRKEKPITTGLKDDDTVYDFLEMLEDDKTMEMIDDFFTKVFYFSPQVKDYIIKDLKNFVKEEQTKIPNQEKNIDLGADWNFSGDVKFNDEED